MSTTTEPKRITKLRKIVADHQCAKVERVLIDATTASVMVQVYDGINDENKAKLLAMPIAKAADVCWKVAGRARR